jgi:hypothetical protein
MSQSRALRKSDGRSSERQALASAIAELKSAAAEHKKISQTLEHATEVRRRAYAAVDAVTLKIEEARKNEGANLAARALGEVSDFVSVADAEDELKPAVNDYHVAQNTEAALKERLQWSRTGGAEAKIRQCVGAVLRSELPASLDGVMTRARTLQDELTKLRQWLRFVDNNSTFAEFNSHGYLGNKDDPLRRKVYDLLTDFELPNNRFGSDWDKHPSMAELLAKATALTSDPDAPVPEV